LSALFSIPQFFLFEEALIQNTKQCWIDLGEQINWQIYMSTVSTLVFFIPAIIITMCYAIIVKTIWSKGTYKMPKRDKRTKARRNSDEEDHENSRRASSRGIIPRAKVKTVKMTFVIVIVFILCWSPYIIFDLLQVFEQIPPSQTYIAIASLVQSLAPLNSAANPLIYCLFSNESWKTLR
jgi:neuropeptide S receptor